MAGNKKERYKASKKIFDAQNIKILEIGKFYLVHDGSQSGHPGLIIWKNDAFNLYLAIKFGTSANKGNILLSTPISSNKAQSYIYKRLFLGKRKDFGKNEYTDLHINQNDLNSFLKKVDYLNPIYSKNVTKKNKHTFLFYIKKAIDRP